MAKAKLNPLFTEISGSMGDFIFKTSKNGEVVIASRPQKSQAEPSEAQIAQRNRFRQAAAYAKAVLAEPSARAYYEAEAIRLGKTAYSVARSDFLKGINLLENKN